MACLLVETGGIKGRSNQQSGHIIQGSGRVQNLGPALFLGLNEPPFFFPLGPEAGVFFGL
jgi:hypothetical protein